MELKEVEQHITELPYASQGKEHGKASCRVSIVAHIWWRNSDGEVGRVGQRLIGYEDAARGCGSWRVSA
jgi:hypothetical protein